MRRIRWLLLAAAVGSLCAGVAVAARQPPETTAVTADFEASLVSVRERPCDAGHVEFRLKFEGSQTSSDPRLTGDLDVKARSVVNTENGYGYSAGRVLVSDPATGRPKFRGPFVAVLEPDEGTEGFLTGHVVGRDSVRLLANFNAQQDPSGTVRGELGKDGQTGLFQDPAVLTNACRGDRDDDEDEKDDRDKDHDNEDDD